MSLKTYDRTYFDAEGRSLPWPFNVIDDDGVLVIDSWTEIAPGKWVTHVNYGGKGMVVAVNDEQLTILWSEEPRGSFTGFTAPLVRRVFVPQIAQQLVSIQPMSLPSASIFYMDYTYGEEDRKCTEGPLWSKLYWRTRRWLRKTRPSWSSWQYWWRSRFGKRLSSGKSTEETERLTKKWAAASQVTPDQTKAIVDQWVNRNAAKTRGPGIQGR